MHLGFRKSFRIPHAECPRISAVLFLKFFHSLLKKRHHEFLRNSSGFFQKSSGDSFGISSRFFLVNEEIFLSFFQKFFLWMFFQRFTKNIFISFLYEYFQRFFKKIHQGLIRKFFSKVSPKIFSEKTFLDSFQHYFLDSFGHSLRSSEGSVKNSSSASGSIRKLIQEVFIGGFI